MGAKCRHRWTTVDSHVVGMMANAMGKTVLPNWYAGPTVERYCVRCCRRKDGTYDRSAVDHLLSAEDQLRVEHELWIASDAPSEEVIERFEWRVEHLVQRIESQREVERTIP